MRLFIVHQSKNVGWRVLLNSSEYILFGEKRQAEQKVFEFVSLSAQNSGNVKLCKLSQTLYAR
ncbi:hypothetical protein ATY35_18080 [Vibrio cidicii]|uniref:Uncharacterized protein n=1 Tax=Vibrio cidicii TaxID=1763883 RepID=A0ABR5W015_9VIBR|nr:hypothetical protein ATY36_12020 [Vibrio cidicii]KYN84639.1 hypothetical protein ATY35_18080 [Vibrio cidicii]